MTDQELTFLREFGQVAQNVLYIAAFRTFISILLSEIICVLHHKHFTTATITSAKYVYVTNKMLFDLQQFAVITLNVCCALLRYIDSD